MYSTAGFFWFCFYSSVFSCLDRAVDYKAGFPLFFGARLIYCDIRLPSIRIIVTLRIISVARLIRSHSSACSKQCFIVDINQTQLGGLHATLCIVVVVVVVRLFVRALQWTEVVGCPVPYVLACLHSRIQAAPKTKQSARTTWFFG